MGNIGIGPILLISIILFVILFLVFREVNCWYWKVNERLDEQKKTNALLQEFIELMKGKAEGKQ